MIGGSAPWDRVRDDWLRSGLKHQRLRAVLQREREAALARYVHDAFARYGVRYVSQGGPVSRKARAAAHNLLRVEALGGPKAFFRLVSRLQCEGDRITLVRELLDHVALKGARDLLMGTGLVRHSIALDPRVMGVLEAAGLLLKRPAGQEQYDVVERLLLERVCRPLGWEGIELDRTLYQRREMVEGGLRRARPSIPAQRASVSTSRT